MLDPVEQQLMRAEKLIAEKRWTEAEYICSSILECDSQNIEALFLLGTLAFSQKSWPAAIDCFSKACSITPDNPVLLSNFALALLEGGRSCKPVNRVWLEKAATTLQTALNIKGDYVTAWKNLGVVRRELGDSEGAIACFTQGLSHNPADTSLWMSLGSLHTANYNFDRAIECYRRMLQLNPEDPAEVLNRLATLQCYIGEIRDSVSTFRHAVALAPILEQQIAYEMNRLFTLHYLPQSIPEEIAQAHRSWGNAYFPAQVNSHFDNTRDPDRRLRIGYVSPDLRMNAVLFFIQPVLAVHDSSQVEIYCYSNVKTPDHATEQLREKHRVIWRDIVEMDDIEAADMILNDRIDILVDLTGHGGDNRLSLFARKPAPVQVTWIGYPDTTGLPAMDYRFTDATADPYGMTDHLHTEKLIRLPGCFLCYHPGGDFPSEAGLPFLNNGFITFGCMNNFSKINDQMINVWCGILRLVPDSRLMIRYRGKEWERINKELSGKLERNGISSSRLMLLGHAKSVVEQLQAYHQMDIALDTFPYNGTTTTCESLYMGVPVVSLAGRTHVARVGASLLKTIGLADLVAESDSEYVNKAVTLARDTHLLTAMRAGLRNALMSCPLTDSNAFTLNVEQAYREIWQTWCKKQSFAYLNPTLIS